MPLYGDFEYNDKRPNSLEPPHIPIVESWKEIFDNFFTGCYTYSRAEEGMIIYLHDKTKIVIKIMELVSLVVGDDFIGFSFYDNRKDIPDEEKKPDIVIPYSSISYFKILPYNPKTYEV